MCFLALRQSYAGSRFEQQLQLHLPQKHKATEQDSALRVEMMMMLFIGTHSVTTTLNVHSRSRSFVIAIDLRGLAPSMRLFRRPNTNSMKK